MNGRFEVGKRAGRVAELEVKLAAILIRLPDPGILPDGFGEQGDRAFDVAGRHQSGGFIEHRGSVTIVGHAPADNVEVDGRDQKGRTDFSGALEVPAAEKERSEEHT